MSEFERIVRFEPAFDKRDPDPKKNYGIHGVTLRMVLKGEKGATQFVLYTNWQLPHVREEEIARLARPQTESMIRVLSQPLPADVGYHSFIPMYEGQQQISDACEFLDGKPCYYDGSGLAAERVFDALVERGDEAVWAELEAWYRERFEASDAGEEERTR